MTEKYLKTTISLIQKSMVLTVHQQQPYLPDNEGS